MRTNIEIDDELVERAMRLYGLSTKKARTRRFAASSKGRRSLATTDVIMMEILAGARTEGRSTQLRRLLLGFTHLPAHGLPDFEAGAGLYRECRRRGYTPRSLNDC